jgi:hypothetical protein
MRTTKLTKAQLARIAKVAATRKKLPSNESLAKEMSVSLRTIEFYITRFMRKPARIKMNGNGALGLDSKRFRQLIQLCHPDKHQGSVTAKEITQWLLEHRPS